MSKSFSSVTPLPFSPLDEEEKEEEEKLPLRNSTLPPFRCQARVVEAVLTTIKESLKHHEYPETFYFWSSQTAFAIYIIISLAMLVRHAGVLYAILPVMSGQVAWVVSKWTFYILDDAELDRCIRFIQTWLQRLLNEGEKLVQNQDAIRMIVAGSIISNASTGVQYARMVLRARMSQVNQQYITEISDRFQSVALPKLPPAPSVPSLDQVIGRAAPIMAAGEDDDNNDTITTTTTTGVAKTKTESIQSKIQSTISPKRLRPYHHHHHHHHHHRHLFGLPLPFGKRSNSHTSLSADTDASDGLMPNR